MAPDKAAKLLAMAGSFDVWATLWESLCGAMPSPSRICGVGCTVQSHGTLDKHRVKAERDKVGGCFFPCSILGALLHYGCCFVRDNQTNQSSSSMSIIQRSSGKVMVDSTKFCYCSETTLRACSRLTYQSIVLGEATMQV